MAQSGKKSQQVEGVIEHLNFSKNGDPNGAVLTSGQFIHMKRKLAKAANLRIGQEVKLQGKPRGQGSAGHEVIEAEVVNGIDLKSKRAATRKRPGKKAPVKKVPAKKAPAAKKKAAKKAARNRAEATSR